ncbi:hypothetical protein [Kitasatospora fiedleri]|uniref:hypothetical protein n=1 Tax=Kitasatospora fiedleri TaxID=2991545 RepID=UPI002499DCC0|nr:hypothetical protein [Kitasatospora fiedleri]
MIRASDRTAPVSTVTDCPAAIGTPDDHREPATPSSMFAGTSPPPVEDADADHPVRDSTLVPPPPELPPLV